MHRFSPLLFVCGVTVAFAEDPIPSVGPLAESDPAPAAMDAPAAVSLFSDESSVDEAPVSGEALLADCVARMPLEKVLLGGFLNMRKRYGVSLKDFRFAVEADFSKPEAPCVYRLFDGTNQVAGVTSTRGPNGSRNFVHESAPFSPVDASEPILGTDVTWLDVGLDFIWWKNPVLVGRTERIKGRVCDLLDVEPPVPLSGCAKARLWIDRSQKVVLQAAQLSQDGKEVRRVWIRAVQKVDNHWIFKDLEVETTGTGHRTRVHFDDVSFPDAE